MFSTLRAADFAIHNKRPQQTPENPQIAADFAARRYMSFSPVAKSFGRITIDSTGCRPSAGSQAAGLIAISNCDFDRDFD
jgi:hypothetical protein